MEDKRQRSMTVLVIDDDDRVRTLLRDIILFAGHRVLEARDGHSGMRYVEEGGFDIVLTDLGMPWVNGWEVAKCVKQKTPKTPVILITGWGLELDETKIKELGVDFVISKPFQIQDIISTVNRFASGGLSEVRSQRSEVRDQGAEGSRQKAESRGQRSAVRD